MTPSNPVFKAISPHVPKIGPDTPVIDFDKSKGARMFDMNVGKLVIDFAAHFASLPLGYNHPGFFDPEYEKELLNVSRIRIANLDYLCEPYVRFLETFKKAVGLPGFEKYFFINGGGLAVENALKAAMDWKVNRNLRNGKGEKGTEIIHFREAFHGRTGYTMSMTNTADPNKTKYYAKFDWPRITNPKIRFPMEGKNLEATIEDERAAEQEIKSILEKRADDIAAIIIEPIQGEGGDNHFRPEFLKLLRKMADDYDVILIFDEVQCGMGTSGKMWACQHHGVFPDIICFAKKAQVGGMLCHDRLMEEPENVYTVPSRISSTWGSSLTDMVRCRRYLEIYEEENLVENAAQRGDQLLNGLHEIATRTGLIENVRGKGLFMAFDMIHPSTRVAVHEKLYENGLMALMCGENSIRFRPHMNVTKDVCEEALEITEKTLKSVEVPVANTL